MLDVAATKHLKRGQTQMLLQLHLRPVSEEDRVYRLGIITLTYYAYSQQQRYLMCIPISTGFIE